MDLSGAKLLCVAAHPDDETIGCGGTLARAAEAGAEVRVLLPLRRSDPRGVQHWPALCRQFGDAVRHLGGEPVLVAEPLAEARVEAETMALHALIEPWADWCDVLLSHWPGDVHQTHRGVARAVEIATRPFRRRRQVLLFEVATSSDQGFGQGAGPAFSPNLFVGLEERHVARKLQAMALYASETTAARSPEGLRRQLGLRGDQVGLAYAEAFILARGFV